MMTTVVLAVVGLLLGLAIGFLSCAYRTRGKMETLTNDNAVLITQYKAAEQGRVEALSDLDRLRNEARTEAENLRRQMAEEVERARQQTREQERQTREDMLQQMQARHKDNMEAMTGRFEETIAKMREEVTNVTAQLLERRQREFADSSKESLAGLMEPLQQNINKMNEAVRANTLQNTQYSGQLKEGIESVLKQSQLAMQSADKLANVLSASNKVQGEFGEQILTELLESSGLREGIHFETQYVIKDENGRALTGDDDRMRKPDVVVHLDKGHHVIIDSKVSLTAFRNYASAETDVERARYLKEHIDSLRTQARNLAKKEYWRYLPGAVDYVIMFVPITNALYCATQNDPKLWREAMEQRVYIADEQTLYAALKIISMNWRQQAQAENQQKVYALAGVMLKRVQQFAARFASVGTSLKKAQDEYEQACKKLADGGQSIPQTCQQLIKLGAPYERKKTPVDELIDSTDSDTPAIDE